MKTIKVRTLPAETEKKSKDVPLAILTDKEQSRSDVGGGS